MMSEGRCLSDAGSSDPPSPTWWAPSSYSPSQPVPAMPPPPPLIALSKPSESEPDTFEPLPCAIEETKKMREEVNALLGLWSSASKFDYDNSACAPVHPHVESESLCHHSESGSSSTPPSTTLEEKDLVVLPVRELNKVLKKAGFTQKKVLEIKKLRRRLLNRGYANKCRDHRMSEHAQVAETVAALERRLAELERRKEELRSELRRIEGLVRQRDEEERQWREALEEFAEYIEEGELERLGLADTDAL